MGHHQIFAERSPSNQTEDLILKKENSLKSPIVSNQKEKNLRIREKNEGRLPASLAGSPLNEGYTAPVKVSV